LGRESFNGGAPRENYHSSLGKGEIAKRTPIASRKEEKRTLAGEKGGEPERERFRLKGKVNQFLKGRGGEERKITTTTEEGGPAQALRNRLSARVLGKTRRRERLVEMGRKRRAIDGLAPLKREPAKRKRRRARKALAKKERGLCKLISNIKGKGLRNGTRGRNYEKKVLQGVPLVASGGKRRHLPISRIRGGEKRCSRRERGGYEAELGKTKKNIFGAA